MRINDFRGKENKQPVKGKAIRNILLGAGIGSVIGIAAGMILAPKTGKETRRYIKKGTRAAVNTLKDTVSDAKEKIVMSPKTNCYEFHYKYSDADEEEFVPKNKDASDIISDEGSNIENETFVDRDKCCDD